MNEATGARIVEHVRSRRDQLVDLLKRMVEVESPTDVPQSQVGVQRILEDEFSGLGYDVRRIPGVETGGHLFARPKKRRRGLPGQMLVGHTDTVWPMGTLSDMPVSFDGDQMRGPGVFDMKAGLTQIVYALRTLRELELDPPMIPLVFMNSDEEIGSPDSRRYVRFLAKRCRRAFILEPALGTSGKIKTARKGAGRFTITVTGKAAHAGLDPESGASAILELSFIIQQLHEINDPTKGISVNVGVIDGGVRPNVIAPTSRAQVDVRVLSMDDARDVDRKIHALKPTTPGVTIQVDGGLRAPPLERTQRNRKLWEIAQVTGKHMGIELEEATAGGGSDGNTTSQYTATLDGLGAVGDGAHADHEFVYIDGVIERCALLAGLLMSG